ncbi:MAG TPA: sugar phosphate nucleotidyltransferase [Acidobacteriaceae bacterium]|nr:sugar phosphate nucleotidyltransferase [Acidobacteriaceae bacterium]
MPPLALLAGGRATRLGVLAECMPKSLMEVAGEPFIAHQLQMLVSQGVTDVVICCGHLGAMVQDVVGNGAQFGCRVRYSYDGPILLGTGGAIRKALPLLGDCFWVMYGDSFLTLDFRAVLAAFDQSGKAGLMTVFRNDDHWDASNVVFTDGRIVHYAKRSRASMEASMEGSREDSREDAMRHIDYGLSIFRAPAFHQWPVDVAFDLSVVQSELVARREMAGFEVNQRFYEVGSPAGLRETDTFLRSRHAVPAGAKIGVQA